ncbi:hypothetical protein Ancab_012105 [Ancistrocladus abbreviatus]
MESSPHLFDEIWASIFSLLDLQDQCHLGPLSLVSKQFLCVTNQLCHSLKIFDNVIPDLPALLQRFHHIKNVDLSEYQGNLDKVLFMIASSGLNTQQIDLSDQRKLPTRGLRKLGSIIRSVTVLKCSSLYHLKNNDLIDISTIFPLLEELDISNPCNASGITDKGISFLSSKLPSLCKINLAGNSSLSDKSLFSLSSNCANLREITIHCCGKVTPKGVAFLMHHVPNLHILSLTLRISPSVVMNDCFASGNVLHTLELISMRIPDSCLFSIAMADIRLKSFTLSSCWKFTFLGIAYLLHKHPSLDSLTLEGVDFLTDPLIDLFSRFLTNATSIKLNNCPLFTERTPLTLIENCPLLKNLEMKRTRYWYNHYRQPRWRPHRHSWIFPHLSLNALWKINDEKNISTHPNLQYLNLSYCMNLTQEIMDTLGKCKQIRYLILNGCRDIKDLRETSEFPELKTLQAADSGINDDLLVMFAKRCPELRYLNLEFCKRLTEVGVKEVVQNCRKLKEINLRGCCNLNDDIAAWMMLCQPLLRKVIPPGRPMHLIPRA